MYLHFNKVCFLAKLLTKVVTTERFAIFSATFSLQKPAAGFEPFIFGLWVSCSTAVLLPTSSHLLSNIFIISFFLGGGGAFLTWFEFKHVCSLYRWTTISVIDMALVIAFYYNYVPTFQQSMFLSQIVDKSCHDCTIRHIFCNFLSPKASCRIRTLDV